MCMCGATDCPFCYPWSAAETARQYEIEQIESDYQCSWEEAEEIYEDRIADALDRQICDMEDKDWL